MLLQEPFVSILKIGNIHMKEFKLFNVYGGKDKTKMEDCISQYISEGWLLEKMESAQKKDIDGEVFTEYQVILTEKTI